MHNNVLRYYPAMIKTFADKDTAATFMGLPVRKFPVEIRKRLRERLDQLHAAATLDFLLTPRSNRLEKLSGDRGGQYSIRVNDQYRVCFRWTPAGPDDVEIVDYH